MLRSYRRVYLYVSSEFLLSFVVAFLFFFFFFFINQLLVMAEEIFSKKVPMKDVFLLIVYSLPAIVALSFPFGSLVGSLMTVGKLSTNNEILAMEASGVPLFRIFLPLVAIGMLFSVVSFFTNDYLLPLGNIRLGRIYRRIIYANPGVELEPYSIKKYEDTLIVTGAIEGTTMKDIVIVDKTAEDNTRTIIAREAFLEESEEQRGVISMNLRDVFTQVSDSREKGKSEYSSASRLVYNLLLKNIALSLMNPGPGEMSSADVSRAIKEKEVRYSDKLNEHTETVQKRAYDLVVEIRAARDILSRHPELLRDKEKELARSHAQLAAVDEKLIVDRSLQNYRLEFYKKFSVPLSCLVFAVFAFPAGRFAKRSGRSVGFGVGLFVAIAYWGLLFAGLNFGRRLDFSPWLAMWAPNFLVLFGAAVLTLTRSRH